MVSSDSDLVQLKVTKRDLKVAGITTPIAITAYEIFKKYVWRPGIRKVDEYFERKGEEDTRRREEDSKRSAMYTVKLLQEMGYLQKKPE